MKSGSILSVILCSAIFFTSNVSQAQIFPTAAVLLANTTAKNHTINSTEEFLQMELMVKSLSAKLQQAYASYPNMQYRPVFEGHNTIGFVVTGVSNTKDANDISYTLMQLEVIGEMFNNVEDQYIPVADASKVSRKQASR